MNPTIVFVAFLCYILGGLSGLIIAYTYIVPRCEDAYREALAEHDKRTLALVRDQEAREELNTKMLLDELGEALDVDMVELPTFGYVTLKGAIEVSESPMTPHMRDIYE